MAYNRNQARALCNDSEYDLFTASLADSVAKLTAAQLRGKITRARTLRDKNTDLFRRQSLAVKETTGSKRGKSGAANDRTEQKARLFDETLKRLEARLEKVNTPVASAKPPAKRTAAKRAASEAAAKPAKSAARKTAAKPAAPKQAAAGKAAATKAPGTAKASAAKKPTAKKAAPRKPAGSAPPAAKAGNGPAKNAAKKGPAGVSAGTKVRTKVQAAHSRAAGARSQAKRDSR